MSRRGSAVLAIVSTLVLLALPGAAQEADVEDATPASIDLRLVIPSNPDIPPQFVATVRDARGNAVSGAVVDFSREVEFLGTTRLASLGSGTTDVGGTARLVVLPRQQDAVVVASAGDGVMERVEASYPPERVDTFFDPRDERGLLTPIRSVMPALIGVAVALLWVFVIGLAVTTVRRIRQLGEVGSQEAVTGGSAP